MPTPNEQIDLELAQKALAKRRKGVEPTRPEKRALARVEKAQAEKTRWEVYANIPKKDWIKMSGRQHRTINEQAITTGIPFDAKTINLPDVVRAIHDYFAKNKYKLAGADDDDPLLAGTNSPQLEKYRKVKTDLLKLQLGEAQKRLLRRDLVHHGLVRIASLLRASGETLQRKFGPDAADILNKALDNADREILDLVGDGTPDPDSSDD